MEQRVAASELEYDGDIRTYCGEPYNGVAYDLFNDGSLNTEYEYKDGLEHNICREWYKSG